MIQGILKLFFTFNCLHIICCRSRRRHLQSLISMWLYHLCAFWTFGISTLFFADVCKICCWYLWNLQGFVVYFLKKKTFLVSDVLLTSVRCCFSPPAVFLLSSISLLIPTSSIVTSSCSSSVFLLVLLLHLHSFLACVSHYLRQLPLHRRTWDRLRLFRSRCQSAPPHPCRAWDGLLHWTCTLNTESWPQFSIEVSSNILFSLFAGIRLLLTCSVHFLNVTVGIPRVGKVFAHQLDILMVDHNRRCDGPFVDVFSIGDFLSPFLVQHNSNSVFVVVFSCTHEHVFVMCLQKFLTWQAPKCRSARLHPISSLRTRISFPRFFHVSALISCLS